MNTNPPSTPTCPCASSSTSRICTPPSPATPTPTVGCNRELMDACKTLADYARYTQRVRDYAEEMPLNQAVERAVTECIREGILEEFLRENRSVYVSIYEYDAEKHIRQEKEESWDEGFQEGRESLLIQLTKRRLKKGKSVSEIAEDLEQQERVIRELIGKLKEN